MKKFYRALSLFTLLLLTTLALASCGGYCLHKAADPLRENVVPPTLLADGSYDEVLLCEKCGKELAREQKTLIYDGATLVVDLPGVVIDGVSVSARLGHNTESIDLNAVFSATEQATYAFYSDAACQTPVTGNTLALTK
ncbi:MAG: hypothetical protein J6R40_03760, partial [Clostridia bacterium]|nr:hypothetical protein [Clostridia bacterium]